MPINNAFQIAITGDTGYDLYTEYVKGYVSDDRRVSKPEAAYDLYVPAGAALTHLVFNAVFTPKDHVSIEHFAPDSDPRSVSGGKVFSTFTKSLIELDDFPDNRGGEKSILRVRRVRPLHDKDESAAPEVFYNLVPASSVEAKPYAGRVKLLVIHDGAGNWRYYPDEKGKTKQTPKVIAAMDLVEKVLKSQGKSRPCILVNLDHDLPNVKCDPKGDVSFDASRFWTTLADHADKVCVICSVDLLRREGAAISRRLSWEQTIEDLIADLYLFNKLKAIASFRHLIIRMGTVAALHITTETNLRRTADFVFAPLARIGIYRDKNEDGDLIGHNVFLAAAVARMLAKRPSPDQLREEFSEALKRGLLAGMRAFDTGFTRWKTSVAGADAGTMGTRDEERTSTEFIRTLLDPGIKKSALKVLRKGYDPKDIHHDQILGVIEVNEKVFANPPGRWTPTGTKWEILKSTIEEFGKARHAGPALPADAWRINVGLAIVLFGPSAVLNRHLETDDDVQALLNRPVPATWPKEIPDYITLPLGQKPSLGTAPFPVVQSVRGTSLHPLFVPVMTFGKLTVIEREEIESIRSIRNLFKNYIEETRKAESSPPLCVAVFGPPGSGKSFAVKQTAEDINRTLSDAKNSLEAVEYNVAQFRSVEELGDAITRAGVINNEGKTPLVFFDEFDCAFDDRPLGWLKYFLAPMQDGIFYGVRQTIKIARAIFVFAGGVYQTFDDFDPSSRPLSITAASKEGDEKTQRDQLFKDQKGPDFVSRLRGHINIIPINRVDSELKPIIRRAIILRGLLHKRKLITRIGNHQVAGIDEDVLYALLTVDRYRHGARSMEAILHMCGPIDGKIEKASLPSSAQLNMHIDAEEFFTRIYRARFQRTGALVEKAAVAATTSKKNLNSKSRKIKGPGTPKLAHKAARRGRSPKRSAGAATIS